MSIEASLMLKGLGLAPHSNRHGSIFGLSLGYCLTALNGLSEQLGVRKLSELQFDGTTLGEEISEEIQKKIDAGELAEENAGDEYERLTSTLGEWYQPGDYIESARALLGHVEANPEALDVEVYPGSRRRASDYAEGLVEDLRILEELLAEAQAAGHQVRLEVG